MESGWALLLFFSGSAGFFLWKLLSGNDRHNGKLIGGALFGRSSNDNNGVDRDLSLSRPKWTPTIMDCSKQSLEGDILKTWSRPRNKLAVTVDLPRLVRKISVFNSQNEVLFNGSEPLTEGDSPSRFSNITIYRKMSQLFVVLAQSLSENHDGVEEFIEAKMSEEGDSASLLDRLFDQFFPEENRITKLLKLCNQSIMAPAVIRLKQQMNDSFPYKDDRGRWTIEIRLRDDASVVVTHFKREISWESSEDYDRQHFSFRWNLSISTDPSLSLVESASMSIDQLSFVETVAEETRREILSALSSCPCCLVDLDSGTTNHQD